MGLGLTLSALHWSRRVFGAQSWWSCSSRPELTLPITCSLASLLPLLCKDMSSGLSHTLVLFFILVDVYCLSYCILILVTDHFSLSSSFGFLFLLTLYPRIYLLLSLTTQLGRNQRCDYVILHFLQSAYWSVVSLSCL